ncbi:hypothetical protein P8625_06930 [Tenacibaculum tangerinum]|uniref:Bacteriocin n=1 Tax=Tenacibaculum tangerinum TaxID=3038772 RepID=A0ABY8L660_9FLAO|nr:hypothetical protein [Tenacibaculum tangerinum]WGH76870.1 hypothetical protein P8625_06930 [Tenacibaculum tangerinum]
MMKKSILNLGKAISKSKQKQISGGNDAPMGDCYEPGSYPLILIGHAPCDGVSTCPGGGLPFCFATF